MKVDLAPLRRMTEDLLVDTGRVRVITSYTFNDDTGHYDPDYETKYEGPIRVHSAAEQVVQKGTFGDPFNVYFQTKMEVWFPYDSPMMVKNWPLEVTAMAQDNPMVIGRGLWYCILTLPDTYRVVQRAMFSFPMPNYTAPAPP